MAGKTNTEKISEVHTVLLGVPGTKDNGVVGYLRRIEKQLSILNGAVKTNTAWRKALVWVMGAMIAGYAVLNYIS